MKAAKLDGAGRDLGKRSRKNQKGNMGIAVVYIVGTIYFP